MNRIDQRLNSLRSRGRKALVPYITAGHPHPDATVDILHALVESGADLLEVGVPFSDPMADGPVIQRACEIALRHGVTLTRVLEMVGRFREHDSETPVILMGYLNPVENAGYEEFARQAGAAGVDGVLVVDSPPEESVALNAALRGCGLCQIYLLAPTTTAERTALIAQQGSGFLYYVALTGVTGAECLVPASVSERLKAIRTCTELPVGVGFGIKDARSAVALAAEADLVIVGSALVSLLEQGGVEAGCKAVGKLVSDIRQGLDAAGEARKSGVL